MAFNDLGRNKKENSLVTCSCESNIKAQHNEEAYCLPEFHKETLKMFSNVNKLITVPYSVISSILLFLFPGLPSSYSCCVAQVGWLSIKNILYIFLQYSHGTCTK